jgi:glycosyltransferase involved in cell wall biosynthesis
MRWARRHGVRAKLLFVGAPWYSRDNATPWFDYLRAEVERLEEDAVFTGYVRHSEMPTHYALADIVTAPSIWDDPSPFVTYEAQAMECPVLGSLRGGIPEIIADRKTGRCIDVFNIPLFGEILASWIGDRQERHRLGRNGRGRMAERFSMKQAVRQMDCVYRRLLAGRLRSAAD